MPSSSNSFQDKEITPKAQADNQVGELEAGGMLDAFVSLEEISPELDWTEAIADAWGIPHNTKG